MRFHCTELPRRVLCTNVQQGRATDMDMDFYQLGKLMGRKSPIFIEFHFSKYSILMDCKFAKFWRKQDMDLLNQPCFALNKGRWRFWFILGGGGGAEAPSLVYYWS